MTKIKNFMEREGFIYPTRERRLSMSIMVRTPHGSVDVTFLGRDTQSHACTRAIILAKSLGGCEEGELY